MEDLESDLRSRFIEMDNEIQFSEAVISFQERRLPERATPVGYGGLIEAYGLNVPLSATEPSRP
jgi:hypothetical protein